MNSLTKYLKISFIAFLAGSAGFLNAQNYIETVAGGGAGDGAVATEVLLSSPHDIAFDSYGNAFIADWANHRVRKIDRITGIVSTVAGNGVGGFSGDGGQATDAMLNNPADIGIFEDNLLYIADYSNNRVRMVNMITGIISTVAGDGTAAFAGDGALATLASFNGPGHLAIDETGNLYVADELNNRVRKIDAATGIVNTVAGTGNATYTGEGVDALSANFNQPAGLAFDNATGDLYITDFGNHRVRRVDGTSNLTYTMAGTGVAGFSGDTGDALSAELNNPIDVLLVSGDIYISDFANNRVRVVASGTNVITTVAGDGVAAFAGDGADALTASISGPKGLAWSTTGNLYLADSGNDRIRFIDNATNFIDTYAGSSLVYANDVLAADAGMNGPMDIVEDNAGNLYISDIDQHLVRKIDANTGVMSTVAGTGVAGYTGDGGDATLAQLNAPFGLAIDASGDLYIADKNNFVVRKVDMGSGTISTVVGIGTSGTTGDGAVATAAQLTAPGGLVFDAADNLYIADNYGFSGAIRMVEKATGNINTYVSTAETPLGIDIDAVGNIYYATGFFHKINVIDATTQAISTVAGTGLGGFFKDNGDATKARLNYPYDVTLDASGNFYIADDMNNRIRMVTKATGIITTLAGTFTNGFSGDGGLATSAQLKSPRGIHYSGANASIYFADWGNNRLRRIYDPAPVPVITTTANDPTNTFFTVNVNFGETVTGFTETDLVIYNGSAGIPTDLTGGAYSLVITPAASGQVLIDIPVAIAQDIAGNNNEAAQQFSITIDQTAPTPLISSSVTGPTGATVLPITIDFGEEVTGFDITDLIVANATTGTLAALGAGIYSIDLLPVVDGLVTLDIAASAALDKAANNSLVATQWAVEVDNTSPVPVISSTASNPTANNVIPVTIDFGEAVTGFVNTDLVIANGTAGALTDQGGGVYTLDVTATVAGTVTIDLPAAAAQDAVGNNSAVATQYSMTLDQTGPTPAISSVLTSPTGEAFIPLIINFGEEVTGFVFADIVVANATKGTLANQGAGVYALDLVPVADGAITVDIAAAAAADAAGNASLAAVQFTIDVDVTAPAPIISTTANDPSSSPVLPVSIDFGEVVTGFVDTDLLVSNGTVGVITDLGGGVYSFDVTAVADGVVTIDLPANSVLDVAGKTNTAADQFVITVQQVGSTPVISTTATDPTSNPIIPVTIDFGEIVTGFIGADLAIGNGTAGIITNLGGGVYSLDVTAIADGQVTVDIPAGVVLNGAGIGNIAAQQLALTVAQSVPTPVISSTVTGPVNLSSVPITIDFAEPMTGFVETDIIVLNATLANFTDLGNGVFGVDLLPLADGPVTVDIPASVAVDNNTNLNLAAIQFVINVDITSPTPVISTTATNPATNAVIPFTVDFGETVNGFADTDLVISNGTIGALTDQGAGVFSFDITALANGTVTIDVAAGAATDAAGNSSQAATQFSIDAAFSAPVPVITSTEPNPTSSSIIPLTIDFGEVVTGFDVTKLVVSNATPGVLNDLGGGKYTINVIAIAEGPVTVDVAAAVAQNTSGVFNAAAVRFAITIIKTGPTPVITSLVTGPTGQLLIPVKIDFGGEVTSFDVADLLVFNATMGTLANLGGGLYSMDLLPGSDGVVTVDIGAGAAFDLLNNKSQAAVQFAIDVDVTSPKPILSTTLADPTSSALIPVTIDFGEVVSGFDATDLVLSNGTVGLAFDLGGGVFSADITATGDGPVTINLPGNIALDAVGNNSLAADQLAIIVDRKGPVPVITSTEVSPTTAMTIPLTIDFGEVVTGFDGSDLIITNAVAGSLWDQGNGKFGLDITAEKRGPVTVNIGGGAASDLVGNASVAMDAPFTIAFDPILGLAEDEFKQALNIYPNPGRGVFYMNFDPAVFKSDVLIKVIGVNGAEIKSMHIEPHQFNRFMLDMSSFGPGLYIANIMNNQGQVITRKKIQVIN